MTCTTPSRPTVTVDDPTSSIQDGATVIEGHVRRDGQPAPGAYVRLLSPCGQFVADVVVGADGRFRFRAAPGLWTVRALAPGARGARTVEATAGRTLIDITLGALPS